ncbi:MAG: hypothetical protein ACNA8W_09895 [Bradymonadaceae bacterium]
MQHRDERFGLEEGSGLEETSRPPVDWDELIVPSEASEASEAEDSALPRPTAKPAKPKASLPMTPAQKMRREAAVTAWTIVVIVFALLWDVSLVQNWRLANLLAEVDQHRATDTYASHIEALAILEEAEADTRHLPGPLDRFFFGTLPRMPLTNVAKLRARAADERVVLASLTEWRFEWFGAREAARHLEAVDKDSPAGRTARVYLMLVREEEDDALELARESWERDPDDHFVQEALAEAVLTTGAPGDWAELGAVLEVGAAKNPWRGLLAARLNEAGGLSDFLADHPEHVEAQIEGAGRGDESIAALRALAARTDPDIGPTQKARAHYTLGLMIRAAEDMTEAAVHFQNAIDAAPARIALYPVLIDLHIGQRDYDEALEVTEKMAGHADDPKLAALLVPRARVAHMRGKPGDALQLLEEITEPTFESHWTLGHVHLELDDPGSAERAFREAVKKDGGSRAAKAFALYGELARGESEEPEQLLNELKELAEANEEDHEVRRAYGLGAVFEAESREVRRQRRQGLEGARDFLRETLELVPMDVLLRYDLCAVEVAMGSSEEADEACQAALELNPAFKPGALHFIGLRLLEERFGDALELVSKLEEHHGEEDFQLSMKRAEALIGLRRFEDAEAELERWTGSDHEEALETLLLKGRLAFARHQYEEAHDFFWNARELDRDHVEARVMLGHALVRLEGWEEGWEAADALLRDLLSDPIWGGQAWFALGELRRRQERFGDARINLRRAGERLEGHIVSARLLVLINVELALAWEDRFNWDHRQVARHLELAREHAEESELEVAELLVAEARYHLGKRRGELALAREALERATEVDPLLCEGWRLLERIYRATRARAELRRLNANRPAVCR